MQIENYTKNALRILKSENAGRAGDLLRYGGLLAGAIAGGFIYNSTGGDAVAATHAMVPGAAAFATGEGIRAARDFARDGIGNIYQIVGRAASVAAPVLGTIFLSDGNYQPALDLGPVALWGTGQLPRQVGDRMQEKEVGYQLLREKGIDGVTEMITSLPDEKLAPLIGKIVRDREIQNSKGDES